MIKIVCISDTHNQLNKLEIPTGDILIHAGDLTSMGSPKEVAKETYELGKQLEVFKHVVLICGNHDWLGEKNPAQMEQLCKDNGLIYLRDSGMQLEGLNIWGSPYQPAFCGWAFNLPRGVALKNHWDQIPDNTNILVTHGPPKGILDECPDGFRAGCEDLWNRVNQLNDLKIHVFGHIHHSYGIQRLGNTTFVNASTCTERYLPTNDPIVIDL